MDRKNCWEVLKCGRGPGRQKVDELGICPAVSPFEYEGVNVGKHAGRFCWVVAGTFCNGKVAGTLAEKLKDCLQCDFLKHVNEEEGKEFILTINNYKRKLKEEI